MKSGALSLRQWRGIPYRWLSQSTGKCYNIPGGLTLAGPQLSAVVPNVARSSEVIRIKGKYFKDGHTTVIINGSTRAFNFISSKELETSVPTVYVNGPVPVKVLVYNKEITRNDIFSILNPEITDINPTIATFGDIITITGVGFVPGNMQLRMGDATLEVIEETATQIRFRVPNNSPNMANIRLFVSGTEVISEAIFYLKKPVITSLSALYGKEGDHITLFGNYFNPETQYEQVYFRNSQGLDAKATILSGTTTSIDVEIPALLQDEYSVMVNVNYSAFIFNDKFTYSSPWKRVDFSIEGSHCYGTSVYTHHENSNQTGFLDEVFLIGGFNIYGSLELVNFTNQTISFHQNVPYVDQDVGGCAFKVFNSIIYLPSDEFNSRTQTVYRCDVIHNQWATLEKPFPGPGRRFALAFSANDSLGYILGGANTGVLSDFWVYHGITGTWENLNNFPGGPNLGATAVVSGQYVYVLNGTQLWRYHPSSNTWSGWRVFPGPSRYRATGFALNGKIYFGTGISDIIFNYDPGTTAYKDMWQYDPLIDNWKQVKDLPGGPRNGAFGFELNAKGYIGGGNIISYNGQTDIYEYNPDFE